MVLNNDNVYDFASLDSKIKVITKSSDGSYTEYDNDFYERTLHVTGIDVPYIGLELDGGNRVPYAIDVGDVLRFNNPNGTITRAEVLGIGNLYDSGWFTENLRTDVKFASVTTGSSIITINTTGITRGMKINCITPGVVDKGAWVVSVSSNTITITSDIKQTSYFGFTFINTGTHFKLDVNVYKNEVQLPWFNCFSYGNGLESNRIRDDFNAPTISNGVKASTTFLGYGEEVNYNGLIYSGIINSSSKVNKLHEFNMGQSITKDLNPEYGSIQVIKSRNSDLNVFTQDKVLKVLANKDALYNADGNTNITATNRVLGQAIPYAGDYGISNQPTSLAWDQYRMYFCDTQRGAVLRLSNDGLTPISDIGMKKWFREALKNSKLVLGSFDVVNGEFNITIEQKDAYVNGDYEGDSIHEYAEAEEDFKNYNTLSFSERGKGWVSFKSWHQNIANSFSGEYFTTKNNRIWMHNSNEVDRLNFYGQSSTCRIVSIINDEHDVVKNFKSIEYSGSDAVINNRSGTTTDVNGNEVTYSDGRYDDNGGLNYGWTINVETDLEKGRVPSNIVEREGKWFGAISGAVDTFGTSASGIGIAKAGSTITSRLNATSDQTPYVNQEEINVEINIEDIL